MTVGIVRVDDAHDPRLADYRGVRHLRRESDEWFIVETVVAIERLLHSSYPVRSLLLTEDKLRRLDDLLGGVDCPVYVLPRAVMADVVGFQIHRGAMAAAGRRPLQPVRSFLGCRRLVLMEGCVDHENLGAVARSARALGYDGLLTDTTSVDPLYRRSVRVSMGEVLHIPLGRCDTVAAALAELHGAGFLSWALTPGGDVPLWQAEVPKRLVLVVGAEGPGLSKSGLSAASQRVRIPMVHGADSLNVGHAAAIAMAWANRS
jgi:tRNA G18 (ribose-2'-O)-methylase SpoU